MECSIFGLLFLVHISHAIISIPLEKEEVHLQDITINDVSISPYLVNNKGIHPSQNLDFKTFQYFGKINVGTPSQEFNVAFSPLTPKVIIPSNMCTLSCGPRYHNAFKKGSSKTYRPGSPAHASYLNYNILEEGYDNVEIDKFVARNQTIDLILDGNCDNLKYDGILGLGFSGFGMPPSFIDNLFSSKSIPQKAVGIYINRDMKCSKNCGEIVLGSWNNAKIHSGSIKYIDAIPKSNSWKILIKKVLIGSANVGWNSYAVLDTASSFIRVPEAHLKIIINAIHPLVVNNTLLIDRQKVKDLPSLTFNIGENDYTLTGSDYVDTVDSHNGLSIILLTSNANSGQNKDSWILGNAFLGKYYTILNYEQRKVAFATISGAPSLVPASFGTLFAIVMTVIGRLKIIY